MSGFRDQGFGDRRSAADSARKAMQQRFHATAGADDPALVERKAARQAISAAREVRLAERVANKAAEAERGALERACEAAEQKARETAERELRLQQEAREIVERAERQACLRDRQTAAREPRYASQKLRK